MFYEFLKQVSRLETILLVKRRTPRNTSIDQAQAIGFKFRNIRLTRNMWRNLELLTLLTSDDNATSNENTSVSSGINSKSKSRRKRGSKKSVGKKLQSDKLKNNADHTSSTKLKIKKRKQKKTKIILLSE